MMASNGYHSFDEKTFFIQKHGDGFYTRLSLKYPAQNTVQWTQNNDLYALATTVSSKYAPKLVWLAFKRPIFGH